MASATRHRDYFRSITPLPEERLMHLQEEARRSLESQAEIEAADSVSFDEYLEQYFAAD